MAKTTKATDRERECLRVLFDYNPDPDGDGGVIFYAHITDALGIELGQARRSVRSLVRKGLASRNACFDDDGVIQGSGFVITHDGINDLNAGRAALQEAGRS